MSNVSILIIEDESIIAEDIRSTLVKLDYDVAGTIGDSEKAVDYLSFHRPDLVLCDIRIRGSQDGIDIAGQFQASKKIPFVFITSMADRDTLDRAKRVLPYGYIVKPFTDRDIQSSIELALYKHSQEIEKLGLTPGKINAICLSPLTYREFATLLDLTRGLNNQQISDEHHFSINTTKFHIRNLLAKLEVNNRAEALHKIIGILSQ